MNEQEFTPEPAGLVPLVLIAVEVDEPVEHVVDRFSDEIVLDDVGMRAIPAAAARQFLTERAEQTARMEEQSRRIQEEMALMPRPAPGGIPAREGLNAHESLIAADSSYVSPAEEFGRFPRPNFLVEALEAGQRKQLAERAAIRERKKEK